MYYSEPLVIAEVDVPPIGGIRHCRWRAVYSSDTLGDGQNLG